MFVIGERIYAHPVYIVKIKKYILRIVRYNKDYKKMHGTYIKIVLH